MRIKRQEHSRRSSFQFGKANDKRVRLSVWSQQTQPHHKQYYPMPETSGEKGELCKSGEWHTFETHLFNYFRLEKRKISWPFRHTLRIVHVSIIVTLSFLLLFSSFLPTQPAPCWVFSFPPPRYQITWEPSSFRPSTLLKSTPFLPLHRICDGLIHQSTPHQIGSTDIGSA